MSLRPAFRPLIHGPRLREILLATTGLLALVLVFFAYSVSLGQVFLVEARSFSAEITFAGEGNDWQLPPFTLCVPRQTPAPGATADSEAACDRVLFQEEKAVGHPVPVVLPPGMKIWARVGVDGGLTLTAREAQVPATLGDDLSWGAGGVILVAPEAWRRRRTPRPSR